ncbi:ABC transporter permease [Natronolimnobius sp. AArcel1]|uniref:ABC transporter permease n=1 Tax=Natronolimnobius sp. AArcel1 TaxID=1679093 RepID=UPI0013EAB52C|nr:ABC transporter permease [Natronolimnobius sp. AArcel1]NGM69757.1 ABC transporter permease [Natronolimnobius sp. AArcel1]
MSLRRFALKRLLLVVPTLFGVSVLTFALVHLTPGDPVNFILALEPEATEADRAALRAEHGLDQPVYVQYFDWATGVLTLDFGTEIQSGRPVSDIILTRLPPTIALGIFGWVFAIVIAIPTGIYAAMNRQQLADDVSRVIALAGIAIPNFWLGLILILVFAVSLGPWTVLPPRQPLYHPEMLFHLILPGLTIGTASAATMMRIMRSSMAEELNKDYVTTARAKGLPERTVILKHVLRNSLISVVTVAAFITAGILAGSVVVEVVFAWPGLGYEFIGAIEDREYYVIMGITLFIGIVIIVMNLLADLVYALLDPRIRY